MLRSEYMIVRLMEQLEDIEVFSSISVNIFERVQVSQTRES